MKKTYNPQAIEAAWYQFWEGNGYFSPCGGGQPYCIMLPPPNVTGSLHMGHAFQQTLMDILIRYHRMRGDNTLWQCGTDHAGIATQMVVERQLEQGGKTRLDMGREPFIKAVWAWKRESGNTITRQSRRLGTSMDWSRERFTMDAGLSHAVTEVFVRLYEEGVIYRGQRLVNWDPVLHTAISDLEVVSEEEDGHLWHMRYPRTDGKGHVVVATTRPETMLGDAAVAVHPDDERYQDLVGKEVELPLTGRTIPVIADDYVDPEFGSGCVKITPAHDFNDYEVGKRHNLTLYNIFTKDAKIVSDSDRPTARESVRYSGIGEVSNVVDMASDIGIPIEFQGLDRYEARKKVISALEDLDLIEKVEDHKLMVPRGDRSGVVVEPYLTDQWYVKIQPLAEPAIEAVEEGRIQFVPDNWSRTYFEWMRNIQDWCISRQLWWGHRIPAWYDEEGNIYVGRNEEEVCKAYFNRLIAEAAEEKQKDELKAQLIFYELSGYKDIPLTRDEDVLDTWFSSALWPFSTLGWPEETEDLKTFYPTSVLVTGFDIIFFWVARMIMMGLKFMGDVPFKEVYIHGLVRDSEGQKMSKSKGNILDPLDLIDGISLEELVAKRTNGLMQPKLAPKIEKATRRDYPQGIEAYGTDSLRFTFASLATQGRDIRFDVGRIQGYRNFCNKLWNATRYVMLSVEDHDLDVNEGEVELGLPERWINTMLANTITTVEASIDHYRFDLASQALYEFTWDEYCDWYLELSKTTLNDDTAITAEIRGTLRTLLGILEVLLRLLHPFMPFITEELWHMVAPRLNREGETIMLQPWPAAADLSRDDKAGAEINWLKAFILGVRRIRAERDIPPAHPLAVSVAGGSDRERKWLKRNHARITTLARVESITPVKKEPRDAIAELAGEMTLLVPLADLIDPTVELQRLEKELNKLKNEQERTAKKLDNESFIYRAPEEIVDKERRRLEEVTANIARLERQHKRIRDLVK
jgi:valyl-tRNA synthetase